MHNALTQPPAGTRPTAAAAFTEKKFLTTLVFVVSLFMLWGIAITMGDVLNRHFQDVLHVSKAESGLVQFSIFGAYAVMGIPAGLFMKRFGYKNGVLLGLTLYALGAFLFVPAANAESFGFFRLALFVLACGLATLETVAHPFVAALGPQPTSDQRINFAQAFNGLGAVIGPLLGGYFILRATEGPVSGGADLDSVKLLYVGIGIVIACIAVAFFFVTVPPIQDPHAVDVAAEKDAYAVPTEPAAIQQPKKLFQHRHFRWAVAGQFFNVAAQGGTWAFFINYGVDVMGLIAENAAYYFSLSMVMMMVGRFLGTFLMRFIAPNKLLAAAALCNIVMCLIVAQGWGVTSFVALILVNFFFSIMFPTIFSLALKDLGPHTQQASSFITMGVVGGALFPPVMGLIADQNVAHAYYLPIICYVVIFLFGARFYQTGK
ncbi:MFS transporter, FHS family, L-fucose permease [Catalinimonas alkaloidigena]|uniref:MFS transporter, FHS family, L-fucose permease n=1 Tax=Catalinimonas alkaloidigena TaxID=1075417 RepID=A0A1G9KEB2_9BACT|nr:L-fucose:H+ symporter permease [Catalinimonas alkaloidigena]SDL48200.1 MFS transporter, FHS family, L-fucose permease [Catalinimonas alkaloidigena]